jgi:hypothetical protein
MVAKAVGVGILLVFGLLNRAVAAESIDVTKDVKEALKTIAVAPDAFASFRELGDPRGSIALPRGTFVTVGSLDLPTGSYVVTASLFFTNDSDTDQALAYCLLLIGGRNAQALETVPPRLGGVGSAVSQALTVADQLFASGSVTLGCTNNNSLGGDLSISTFNINAIKVGTLTFQP